MSPLAASLPYTLMPSIFTIVLLLLLLSMQRGHFFLLPLLLVVVTDTRCCCAAAVQLSMLMLLRLSYVSIFFSPGTPPGSPIFPFRSAKLQTVATFLHCHKAAVVPNTKSNDRTIINQWNLPPTICPFPFPTPPHFIYCVSSPYMCFSESFVVLKINFRSLRNRWAHLCRTISSMWHVLESSTFGQTTYRRHHTLPGACAGR